jgi:aryl-alcohol dehydrogenase-like predicted oxidoreductase
MPFTARTLGSTGLKVGPLGVAPSYGAPAEAFEEAFERGCNYFYWGSLRTQKMARAIKNICGSGRRDDLVVVVQSYSRSASLMEIFLRKALRSLGLESIDILLLGWHQRPPSERLIERALQMKENGLYRFLALSSHNRSLFPDLANRDLFDIFHVRYNAVHRGAEEEVFPHLDADPRPGVVTYTATRWGDLLNPRKMPPGETPPSAADCYRFVLSNPAVDVCMSGPKDMAQMREALRAVELGPLSGEELERMKRIGDHIHAHAEKPFSKAAFLR